MLSIYDSLCVWVCVCGKSLEDRAWQQDSKVVSTGELQLRQKVRNRRCVCVYVH